MCGIAGIINGGSPQNLQRMADIQSHRGPDDWGLQWFDDDNSGLAHRRLSILDLSPAGHQPMVNKSGKRWITFNGEIYNYLEIRTELKHKGHYFSSNSDTEVILAAYDEWGAHCVERFNGMFAFGIYDIDSKELFIARDHLGIKPFYYAQKGETFIFASESKAIFEVGNYNAEIEPDAVISTLLLLWVPEPKTGFKNIFKLPAGHYGFFKNGKLKITEYWDIPIQGITTERSEESYIEELCDLLEQAVQRQMIADVPIGAFLSGGLDSSVIVALMRKTAPQKKISTYTIAFTERDKKLEAMPDDAFYARKVGKLFDTDHHEIVIDADINEMLPKMLWHLDDPVADGAAINTYLISKAAKDIGTTVLLNGMGGDEVFGGYRKHLAITLIARYQNLPNFTRKRLLEPLVNNLPVEIGGKGLKFIRWAKRFLRSAELHPIAAFAYGFAYFTPQEFRELVHEKFLKENFEDLYPVQAYLKAAEKVKHLPLVNQMTYLDTKLFLPGLNLLYSDKASMAASLESRPPLIDKDIVEFAAKLPDKYKINGKIQKYILKKAAEKYLPKEIIYRPKAPFGTPLRAWMKSGLDTSVRATFENKTLPHNNFLKANYPLSLLDKHQKGEADYAHALWGSFAAAKWIDQNSQQSSF